MATYTMSQIENLTGINAHSLRAWERRYSFLKPLRTSTNIRYYNEEHLKKLLNIAVLSRHGVKISKIDQMSAEEINQKVLDLIASHSDDKNDSISALILSMLEFDESLFNSIFQNHMLKHGLLDTVASLIYPFLNLVGSFWTSNRAIPAQEHFISNLIRQKIIANIDQIPDIKEPKGKLLMFLTEGEHHEIGLLLAQFIAKQLGWRVYYLGQDVPTADIIAVHDMVKPDLLFSMVITPNHKKLNRSFLKISNATKSKLLVSGNSAVIRELLVENNITLINSPQELIDHLQIKS